MMVVQSGKFLLTFLLSACLYVPSVLAQEDETGNLRLSIRAFYSFADNWAEFNSRGLVDYLGVNGFDDTGWFSVDYPFVHTEDPSWSLYATYTIRPHLSIGGLYHKAQTVTVAGWRNEPQQETSFRIDLKQSMWALAPIALWEPVGFADLGVGPAIIWGRTAPYGGMNRHIEQYGEQKSSFQRMGAVFFISIGFNVLDRHLYLGLQGQFLYGGTVEIGPYNAVDFTIVSPFQEFTLEARDTRLDQLTMGPVIAINF